MEVIGRTYGRLTIVSIAESNKKHMRVFVKCSCGKVIRVLLCNLKRGKTKSCGCLRKRAFGTISKDHRRSERYQTFRRNILKRDGNKCILCHSHKRPEVHHLWNYAANPRLRENESNGLVLCHRHHFDFHMSFPGGFGAPVTTKKFWEWCLENGAKSEDLVEIWIEKDLLL